MKKFSINIFLAVLYSQIAMAQEINLETNATIWIGGSASFFAGGNTTLNGAVINNGTIISFSDLDFVNNTEVGNLFFNGDAEQTLSGDSLIALNVIVDKVGDLILLSDNLIIQGMLDVNKGVIQSDDEEDLIVTGSSEGEEGYVEGKLIGVASGGPVTFPMGLNGSPNYITLSNGSNGVVLRVIIQEPQNALLPDEDIVGIADEVEWVVQTVAGVSTTEVQLTIDYSGLDLTNFSNGAPIRSNGYEPAIVMYVEDDTLYHSLTTSSVSVTDSNSGQIISSEFVTIDSVGSRFSVAWVPIIVKPEFYVPNSFAPNGEFAENRVFRPYYVGAPVTKISMRVFDAFNETLYSHNESGTDIDITQIGWDGRLRSGKPAENGLYYFTVTLVGAEPEPQKKAGSLLLIK